MTVLTEHAVLCADFILDQQNDGETVTLPDALAEAVMVYERALSGSGEADAADVEEIREQIERWLLVDRRACVALLGPGLGIEQ